MHGEDLGQYFQISEGVLFEHSIFFQTYLPRMIRERVVTEDVPDEPKIRGSTWYRILQYCDQSRDIKISVKRQLHVSVSYLRDITGKTHLISLWLDWIKNPTQELIIDSKLISNDDAILLACFLQTKRDFVDKLNIARVMSF